MATKEEWISIFEQEDGELFATGLIEEVILKSQQILFKKHIDIQILPFTVEFAKQTLLDIINYHFFPRDPGNIDPTLWIPDEEPQQIETDAWARAAIPTKILESHLMKTKQNMNIIEAPIVEKIKTKKHNEKKSFKATNPAEISLVQKSIKAIKPKVQPEIAPAAIKFYRPAETSAIDPQKAIQEENQKAISKIMGSDKKSLQDFTFDLEGRVIPLVEPNWKRNTGVKARIVEDIEQNTPSESTSLKKVYRGTKVRKTKVTPQPAVQAIETQNGYTEDKSLIIPSLIDSIKLAPGVTIREGDRVKAAPSLSKKLPDKSGISLKQVATAKESFEIAQLSVLEEIIANTRPVEER